MNEEKDNDNAVTTLTFGLFPDTNLKVGLFLSSPKAPQELTSQLAALDNATSSIGERYALLDATRIISLNHLGIAANSALVRLKNFRLMQEDEEEKISQDESKEQGDAKKRKARGIAIDTIICCGGSTNVQSVMKDFAFIPPPTTPPEEGTTYNYILLGYNCSSDDEFLKVAQDTGLTSSTSISTNDEMNSFFARERTMQETKDLMKVYKLTSFEVEMKSSSLEEAIMNRVATKFYI